MITSKDVRRAIKTIEESRSSHASWMEYYQKHPQAVEKYEESAGDPEFHQTCMTSYDHVLRVLKSYWLELKRQEHKLGLKVTDGSSVL